MLAVVHNVTAATRLLDVLPSLAADPRLRIVFTCTRSSAFHDGTVEFLEAQGAAYLPWEEVLQADFDLAIAASYGGDLHALTMPLITLPHGMGYNKFLGIGKAVFGLSPEWLTHEGEVTPSIIVLSHEEQVERLRRACPEAVPRVLVAGDVTFDRLLASQVLRETYRRALGIRGGQRLVVVSSTWGGRSLLAADPDLPRRLAAELPVDEYRVAVALHPNIWHGHSPWQVRGWLSAARRSGVLLLPELDGWKGALVASDVVIGDHGSVTYYAMALGRPVVLAAAPDDAVAEDSPIARMLTTVSSLDRGRSLLKQVTDAIETHDPAALAELRELVSSSPGRAATILRAAVYDRLRLPQPPWEAETTAVPMPTEALAQPEACLVECRWLHEAQAEVVRYPAERLRERDLQSRSAHLAVGTDEPRQRWLQLADVVIDHRPDARPAEWIRRTLAAMPGCVVAAAPDPRGRWFAGTADQLLAFDIAPETGPLCASAVYAWLSEERPLSELPAEFELLTGAVSHTVRVTHQDYPRP
ncbi:hypothetical protein [Amycolatopsis magusensis]|uniref:hypothetical protein n=1 Tax=Amycolatopsis magusensis TaxID=882444 RepID=UPI00378877CD